LSRFPTTGAKKVFDEQLFLQELQDAIHSNRITLPTLPEVALRVRDAAESETSTAREIADIVATDAGVSARLLQVANSALYRGNASIDSIQVAVTRLGVRMVRTLVVSLAMKGLFQPTSDAVDRRFREIWEHSVEVAAISRVLARMQPQLNTEQAMLAGLIHNIGALPILVHAQSRDDVANNEDVLDKLLAQLSPIIGRQILETWNFSPAMVAVTEHNNNFTYAGGPQADYVDLIIVSRLQSMGESVPEENMPDWGNIPAFAKLGLSTEVEVIEMEGAGEVMSDVKDMFLA